MCGITCQAGEALTPRRIGKGRIRIIAKKMTGGKNPGGQRNVHVMFKYSVHSTYVCNSRRAALWMDQECYSITNLVFTEFEATKQKALYLLSFYCTH